MFLSLLRTSPLPTTPHLTVCLGCAWGDAHTVTLTSPPPFYAHSVCKGSRRTQGPSVVPLLQNSSRAPPTPRRADCRQRHPSPALSLCARPRQQPVHSHVPRELPLWGKKPRNPGASCISRQAASARGGGDEEAAGGLTWLPGSLMRGDERGPGGFLLNRTRSIVSAQAGPRVNGDRLYRGQRSLELL